MVKRVKQSLMTIIKLSFAGGLIAWLIHSGKLDITQLGIIKTHPSILVLTIAYWLTCLVTLGALRWQLLLNAAGYKLSWLRAIKLQMTGFFFNSTMPGAVGGDLIKVFYVIRDNPGKSKSNAFISILLDRLVGLAGVFSIGLFVVLTHPAEVLASPVLLSLVAMLLAFTAFLMLFFTAALYRYRGNDPFLRLLALPIPGLRPIHKLYESLRDFRNHRRDIFYGLLISVFNQLMSLSLFCFIAYQMLPTDAINYTAIATIFPLGILVTALPVAPGGLGVGHVAFENLFTMVGLTHGANIFNVFVLTQLMLNLFGAIPYLYMRKKEPAALEVGEAG